MTKMTKKQITEMYKGKKIDAWTTITTIAWDGDRAILMSGHYDPNESGYYVDAVIDRNTGMNLIGGSCRPCESKQDAIDVADEIIHDNGINVEDIAAKMAKFNA